MYYTGKKLQVEEIDIASSCAGWGVMNIVTAKHEFHCVEKRGVKSVNVES
jgi:hypothetical protein